MASTMDAVERKLSELNLKLPKLIAPIGLYLPAKLIGNTLWLSGMVPVVDGKPYRTGKVGEDVSLEEGIECAKIATLNGLAWVKQTLGSFERVEGVTRLQGFIACANNFFDQPKVLNGASELLVSLFGEKGRHTRVAVGVSSLPMNVPLELDFIFSIV